MFPSFTSLFILTNLTPTDEPLNFKQPPAQMAEMIELNPIPQLKKGALAPEIKAKAGLLMDYATGLVLYEYNADEELPMASLTKIMTAILILENHKLDEVVPIPSNYASLEGVKIFLHEGEEMTVENLLKALLLPSAGDAAMALAEYHSGSVDEFVKQMNERAKELNLQHTQFANPVGLDAQGHYSTAHDLAQLARYAMQMPDFRDIVQISSAQVTSIDGQFTYDLENTNELLNSYLNVIGVKTGTTDEAGESLINLARDAQGNEVLSVVLNSPSRFQESKSMLDWAFRSYLW